MLHTPTKALFRSGVIRCGVLINLVLLLGACQTPFLVFAGGAIPAQAAAVESFAFAESFKILTLETRPEKPYSVFLRVTVIDEHLYIDAAQKRHWHRYIKEDPQVRIKLGSKVYAATAQVVTDENIRKRFLAGRTIYRLVPRSQNTNLPTG